MGLAIGRREFPIGAEVGPAVLERGARIFEALDSVIEGHNAGDFFAQLPAGFTSEQMRSLGVNRPAKVAQDFPFRPRFADLTRNFRTEHYAPFGARLVSSLFLLLS